MERTRTYECMCLLDNREVRKGWDPLKDAVAGIFTKHGGKILSSRRWDERRLAYAIEGQVRATYLLVYFAIDTQGIPLLRRDLQFYESMLRYMVTDCPDVPAGAYEPEAAFDVNAIPEDDAIDVVDEPVVDDASAGDGDDVDAEPAAIDGEENE